MMLCYPINCVKCWQVSPLALVILDRSILVIDRSILVIDQCGNMEMQAKKVFINAVNVVEIIPSARFLLHYCDLLSLHFSINSMLVSVLVGNQFRKFIIKIPSQEFLFRLKVHTPG